MITIDEITGEIVPERTPAPTHDGDERSRPGDDRLDERIGRLLARQRHRRRRLTDR